MKKKNIVFLILGIILAIIFIIWSVLVNNNKFEGIDHSVLNSIVGFRGKKNGGFYWLVRITTELGFVYIIILVIALFLICFKCNLKSLILGFGVLSTYLINMCVKLVVRRERPLEMYRWMNETSLSYPSSHTMCTTFFYGFIAYILYTSNLKKKIKYPLMGLCFIIIPWVGFTRLALCVHYFSDVVGGFIGGLLVLTFGIFIYELFHNKGYDGFKNMIDKKRNVK